MEKVTYEEENQPNIKRGPLMAVLISGAFVAILNQTLLGTALPKIAESLHINYAAAQWLQSIFMLVNGIMIPITAFLIERFTTRGLFLTAMGSFALGTLISSIAPTFEVLISGRILQAAGAGIMMPLMQTIMFLVYPVDKRGSAMGMFGLVIAFAPAIGPTLSGYLVEHFPWQSVFYVVLPIAVIDLIIAYFILKNVTERTFPKVDVPSIMLSTLGFGGLLYGFSIAGNPDTGFANQNVIISLIIGTITLVWFIIRQLKLKQPILEFRIFQYKVFTLTTAIGMIAFMSMIGGAVILPIMMQDMLGFTPLESGLMLLPGAILMGLMNPITGRLFDKFGARYLSIIGLLIVVITTFMFSNLTDDTTFLYLTVVNAARMFGIAMVMMPVTTAGLNELPRRLMPHGTAMNNTFRQMAGAIGTALLVSVMTTRAIPEQGVQGALHGVNVSFIVAGILAIAGWILSFFIQSGKPGEKQATS
ncbi:EmrB/QacA subfamily drug resistance transporter [Melghiribacillus thermohalophilus]|uniref:EmrB/QacA subfamily drug resistance transporter n=1 Tax=Melghiribacillus thermohalophilus TaxID=1324956 RepID=A0A4R3NAL3_9BACI|nr:MDR family MFS transporter [Melghiribacillus thermohalophilus]TCT26502.1 EmrB/QacA subfamily drug resistance transporter [Melghiribacillus thermohalophilus]